MSISEALEPQTNNRISQPWSYDEINLILRAEQTTLTDEEEQLLQRTLAESFDISHSEFDHRVALANLYRQFSTSVNLCKECLHVKHQEELDKYDGYCQDCASSATPIHEPVDTSSSTLESESETLPPLEPDSTLLIVEQLKQQVKTQNQLILKLQQKVDKLEKINQTFLHMFEQDAQTAQQRYTFLTQELGSLNF